VTDLLEAAKKGAIIPIRLPAQLQAIADALDAAEQAAPSVAPAGAETDLEGMAQLVSHAIHDLRLPLTSIRGYSDMMGSMGPLNDMQGQFLTTIRTNVRRMETLLADVSDFIKLQAGAFHLTAKMETLKNVAAMVDKKMRPLADELHRGLLFDLPQGLPILNLDGEALAKVLSKLVENSLRYSREGGEVRVTASAEGSHLHIQVSDDGIGMTPEEIAKLGTPYFRGEHDVVLQFKGSGLGIPIAYGLVHQLGGRVGVESARDQGTVFTVSVIGMN
jgi:cell cycle sensor histidine kinase DivJ